MARRRLAALFATLLLLGLVGGVFAYESGLIYRIDPPDPDGYERVSVTTYDENRTQLATVEVRVADTRAKRWLGLSDTANLLAGEGMLFVHESEREREYVMRDMSFPLDIVFVGADERVTTIHHAPVPDGDADRRYGGRGKWVLEVPRGWTNDTGLNAGDRVTIPSEARNASG